MNSSLRASSRFITSYLFIHQHTFHDNRWWLWLLTHPRFADLDWLPSVDWPFTFSRDFSLYNYSPEAYLWMAKQAETWKLLISRKKLKDCKRELAYYVRYCIYNIQNKIPHKNRYILFLLSFLLDDNSKFSYLLFGNAWIAAHAETWETNWSSACIMYIWCAFRHRLNKMAHIYKWQTFI